MADITTGLPALRRPEDIQAEQDRARLAALGQTIGTGARRLGAAALDLGTLPSRAIMGVANTAIRVPNAFGAGIPYAYQDNPAMLNSMTPYSDRLPAAVPATPALPAMTAPAPTAPAVQSGAGAGRGYVNPAPVQAPAAGAPKSGGTKAPASMPAGAPDPLIPGETGFYINNRLVPYGTSFNAGDSGTFLTSGLGGGPVTTFDDLPGGGQIGANGQFADPRDAVQYAALHPSFARLEGDKLGAAATTTAAQVGAGATLGAARIRSADNVLQLFEQARQYNNLPRLMGEEAVTLPNGLTETRKIYGAQSDAMPLSPISTRPKAKPVDKAIYTDPVTKERRQYNAATGTYEKVK